MAVNLNHKLGAEAMKSPADKARAIIASSHDHSFTDGRQIVAVLTNNRRISDLSSEELALLAKGHNWAGTHREAFDVANMLLARSPNDMDIVRLVGMYACNAFVSDLEGFASACNEMIEGHFGPAAFWHLLKADRFVMHATGEYELEDFEWSIGDPIMHHHFLLSAANEMEAALACHPDLPCEELEAGWVGDWNQRFVAVVSTSGFEHLKH